MYGIFEDLVTNWLLLIGLAQNHRILVVNIFCLTFLTCFFLTT